MRREPENFSIRHVVSQAKPGVGEVLVNEGVHNRFLCRLLCQAMTQPAWLTARFQYLAPPALWSGRSGQYGPGTEQGLSGQGVSGLPLHIVPCQGVLEAMKEDLVGKRRERHQPNSILI